MHSHTYTHAHTKARSHIVRRPPAGACIHTGTTRAHVPNTHPCSLVICRSPAGAHRQRHTTHTYAHTHKHTHTHKHQHTHKHVRTQLQIQTQTHAHTRAHTHTHTFAVDQRVRHRLESTTRDLNKGSTDGGGGELPRFMQATKSSTGGCLSWLWGS